MGELTIPSSPSWYLSNILACNRDGSVVAYGAKHELVIVKAPKEEGKPFDTLFIPLAHKERISAVAFSPLYSSTWRNKIVSGGDDGAVHLWDWELQTMLLSHTGHHDNQKIVSVDWSTADENLIVSVSDLGTVVTWDLISNTVRRLQIGSKVLPVCLSCCPHNRDVIAVGAKAGLIVIFNIKGDGSVQFRMRAHENDVVSLAWCPVPYNVFQNENSEESKTMLLASGAKDRTIYFWRAGTDGRYETFFNLPNSALSTTGGYRTKSGVGGQGNNWVCVRWPEAHTVLSSSLFGELLSHDLKSSSIENKHSDPSNKKSKVKSVKVIHGLHSKGLFSIAAPNLQASGSRGRNLVWSYALDKHLIAYEYATGKIVVDLTTIGGIVYCMAVSPLDPYRIAIGTGDNKLLVWNMSKESCEDISTHWNKINNKVMAIAWHPTNETLLAFGTGEGRVGVLDVANNRAATVLRLYLHRSVYSLIWSPPLVKFEDTSKKGINNNMALFAVGDGEILQYNVDYPEKDPVNLKKYLKSCDSSAMLNKTLGRTDLNWKYDRTLAAIGNDNGVIYIVDGNNFTHLHTIYAHKKLVQCIVWHPGTVTSESTGSPYANWLASASDNIQVVSIGSEAIETVVTLNTHCEKVVSLAWSPHFNGRLVSASYDYTSQVWDVISGCVLACYDGHHSAVMCCLPSAVHPDSIITGSADNTVRVWDVNKYSISKTKTSAHYKTKKHKLTGVLKKYSAAQEAVELTSVEDGEPKIVGPIAKVETNAKKLDSVEAFNKRKAKSMFPLTSNSMALAKHLNVLWARINHQPEDKTISVDELNYLDFFGDTKSMSRLLMVEGAHHKGAGNQQNAQYMALWNGDIAEVVREACKKKQLNDWLVCLAPMISHKVWVECCKSYSTQLAESGDFFKAASYLLAIHQIEEAVDILIEGKHFKEAVALAKARFSPSDPCVKKALLAWCNQCINIGMLKLSAHCMLAMGEFMEAVDILARSKDASHLSLAAQIAKKVEATEMATSLALSAVNGHLLKLNYDAAKAALEHHDNLKDLEVWIEVCRIVQEKKDVDIDQGVSWLCGKKDDSSHNIFQTILNLCDGKKLDYSLLVKYISTKSSQDSNEQVWLYISGQLILAVAAHLKGNGAHLVLKHLIQAAHSAYNYHLYNPSNPEVFLQLVSMISPEGPSKEIMFYSDKEKPLSDSLRAYIACGAIYWLEHLNSKSLIPISDGPSIDLMMEVVKKCGSCIFQPDIMSYHKIDEEIKKLENVITVSKLKSLRTIKSCKEVEESMKTQCKSGTKLNTDAGKKLMNGHSSDSFSEDEDRSKQLSKMKLERASFEEVRMSVPNPFLAYCSMRKVLQVLSQDSTSKSDTLAEVGKHWEKESLKQGPQNPNSTVPSETAEVEPIENIVPAPAVPEATSKA